MPVIDVGADPGTGVCTPWIDVTDEADALFLCCDTTDMDADLLASAALQATALLYIASGRQFPGHCTETVRPCVGCGAVQFLAYGHGGFRPITACGCDGEGLGGIGCTAHGIALPGHPVVHVDEVKIDGTVLDPSAYRLADGYVVMRVGAAWPCSQDLALEDTEEGTWSITYTYGTTPDVAGLAAVGALTCQIAAACTPGDTCDLPEAVQSLVREGVTMEFDDLTGTVGETGWGIRAVDRWLGVVNPNRLDRPGKMFSTGTIGNLHT